MAAELWMGETGVRTCPRCGDTFDRTHIGATPQARLLCSGCSMRMLEDRRERERNGRYWWAAEERTDA